MTRPAAGLLFGAALLGALAGCGGDPGELVNDDDGARVRDPGYSATDARIVETDASGTPRYTLSAATIRQDPVSLEVALEQIASGGSDPFAQVTLHLREGQDEGWRLTARSGRMPEDASRIELLGDVQVSGTLGRGAEPLEIRTEALSYEMAPGLARSDEDVVIRLSGKRLQARGIEANLKQRQVRLESKVHGQFVP